MTEALEWLIEHQDDSDDEDDETDESLDSITDENVAGPSSLASTKKKSLKDECIELFETGNSYTRQKYALC